MTELDRDLFDPATCDEETFVTEITIDPDGRVFAFGTSRGVLELLASLDPSSQQVKHLIARTNNLDTHDVQTRVAASRLPEAGLE
jgi:hypothetical protein